MRIINTADVSTKFIGRDACGLMTKALGAASGSEKIYVNIDTVPPKTYSAKYHSHSQQEEFFLILSGEGVVRLDHEEYFVKGRFFFKTGRSRNSPYIF